MDDTILRRDVNREHLYGNFVADGRHISRTTHEGGQTVDLEALMYGRLYTFIYTYSGGFMAEHTTNSSDFLTSWLPIGIGAQTPSVSGRSPIFEVRYVDTTTVTRTQRT